MTWHVNYEETTDDQGRGPCSLSIGPYEGDSADAFAFSEPFGAADGVPEDVEAKFALMAAAPDLLAACEALMTGGTAGHWQRVRDQARAAVAKAKGLPDG